MGGKDPSGRVVVAMSAVIRLLLVRFPCYMALCRWLFPLASRSFFPIVKHSLFITYNLISQAE